jgi:glutaredoxin
MGRSVTMEIINLSQIPMETFRWLQPRSLALLSLLAAVGCAAPIDSNSQTPVAAKPIAPVPTQAVAAAPSIDPGAYLFRSESSLAALANHLNKSGAKIYTTFWCPTCKKQLKLFGSAKASLPVVECDPQGKNPQMALCNKKSIHSVPTWEINGQIYPGMYDAYGLAVLSRYSGPFN